MFLSRHFESCSNSKFDHFLKLTAWKRFLSFSNINLVITLVKISQRYSISQKCDILEEWILNNKSTKQTNQKLASQWNIHQALKMSHNLFANIYRKLKVQLFSSGAKCVAESTRFGFI